MKTHMKDRLFRGYGPLIGFAAIFLAVVLLVPSKAPGNGADDTGANESITDLLGDESGLAYDENGNLIDPETGEIISEGDVALDEGATGAGGGSEGASPEQIAQQRAAQQRAAQQRAAQQRNAAGNTGPTKVAGCGAAQVPGDPYSPPCVQFSGSNGGATHVGVTDKEVVVTIRLNGLNNGLVDAVSKTAAQGANIPVDTPDKIQRTITGLTEYFNKRFQFYGRQLKIVMYTGKGDVLQEIIGGGQEGAQADAVKAAKEIKAFAEVAAISAPYAAALAQQGVVNIGAPYVSRNWLSKRAPYSWTPLTDCSTVVESTAAFYARKMNGQVAKNAGTINGQPMNNRVRKTAVIYPDNQEYKECVDAGFSILQKNGVNTAGISRIQYRISVDAGKWVNQIMPKLKSEQYTTILCGCDPIFLSFLTAEMNGADQKYFPEMLTAGVALVDNDLVGQIMQQNVWRNAFGVSFSGPTQAQNAGLGYRAYKSVRADEPALAVELIYQQLYMLAIGVQMAGPRLTPASFQKGMFDYPTHTGPYGKWGFAPGDYSTSDDAREIHWNADAISPATRSRGAWVDSNGGKRFPIGSWPGGQPRAAGR